MSCTSSVSVRVDTANHVLPTRHRSSWLKRPDPARRTLFASVPHLVRCRRIDVVGPRPASLLTGSAGPMYSLSPGRGLGPPRLCGSHRRDTVLVDLDHVPAGIVAARKPPQAFRPPENDRMRIGT